MRVVLDTNILISTLLTQGGVPECIYNAWIDKTFTLLTCREQRDELPHTLRKPALRQRISRAHVGRVLNDLRSLAITIHPLPRVTRSLDPEDDYLLALAQAGKADYLVSGDKSGLLVLRKHANASIVTARTFLEYLS